MLENVLVKKGFSFKTRISIKSIVSLVLVALAVGLPQIVHVALGQEGGMQWLPMYLPVLLGGCILGVWWGLGIGIASPVVSFIVTSIAGNPMPIATRLPFMIVELSVFAVVSGLFSNKISKNCWMAFPAVLLAQVSGRFVFMLLALIFQSLTPFSPTIIWSQIQSGLLGMVLQAVAVPFMVMGLVLLLNKDKNDRLTDSKE